ncbi:mitochondrial calcium uniporter regulator 1 isoform X2 [Pogona vitticeps]|uniref:Mitochondrial calcium uniporter regulator 1 isoform X2 n=1 Tax=Pogona vitticeps TaxID=103695 RepID=A0ABM5GAS2_9SAUR
MLKGRTGVPLTKELFSVQQERGALLPHRQSVVARLGALCSPFARRCLGDWKRAGFLVRGAGGARRHSPAFPAKDGAKPAASRSRVPCLESLRPLGSGARSLSRDVGRRRAVEERDVNISVSSPQFENSKGFTTQQAEVIVSALMNIMKSNMDVIYKDMVTKMQQEIALQQIMSHIGVVKKDMIILEKSEFSALRAVNEKLKLELQQLKKQVMDETSKVRTDSKLDFNLEKSRVKELYSLNERKLLKMRTEIVELHAQQDRALTQTDRKIDTEVAGLKTMLESHKLDNIKYLAGSVFTCLTVALGFYRLWI